MVFMLLSDVREECLSRSSHRREGIRSSHSTGQRTTTLISQRVKAQWEWPRLSSQKSSRSLDNHESFLPAGPRRMIQYRSGYPALMSCRGIRDGPGAYRPLEGAFLVAAHLRICRHNQRLSRRTIDRDRWSGRWSRILSFSGSCLSRHVKTPLIELGWMTDL